MNKRKSKRNKRQEEDCDQEMNELLDITTLKKSKSTKKAHFTRCKNRLMDLLASGNADLVSVAEFKQTLTKLNEEIIEILTELEKKYEKVKNARKQDEIIDEMEKLDEEFNKIIDMANEVILEERSVRSVSSRSNATKTRIGKTREQLVQEKKMELKERYEKEKEELKKRMEAEMEQLSIREDRIEDKTSIDIDRWLNDGKTVQNDSAVKTTEVTQKIGNDMWKQLKRVAIPVFNGDKKMYETWKSAFTACVDQAPATAEYKLLQLRQYLTGEALKCIEGLGHSKYAYESAKERLERKFGGTRRKVLKYIDDLDNFRPIREDQPRDVERFADVLDIAVANLKEANRTEELGDGVFYHKLQKKLPEKMLSRYKRWVHEQNWNEDVETLRKFIIEEAEFQVAAAETLNGLSKNVGNGTKPRNPANSYFGGQNKKEKRNKDHCVVCKDKHRVWECVKFRSYDVDKRWEIAKMNNLCYRCLAGSHLAKDCRNSRICGINGCVKTHNRLLHEQEKEKFLSAENKTEENVEKIHEGEIHTSHTASIRENMQQQKWFISLRTVPVILKHGAKKIVVNALLDDGSTKSYINRDVASELGLQGENQQVTIGVLNGQTEIVNTKSVQVRLESIDGKVTTDIEAFTVKRVTGNLKPINWAVMKKKWDYLKDIQFPNVGPRAIVDILIGVDYAELHSAKEEVRRSPHEPIARRTPLGWTCIGGTNGSNTSHFTVTKGRDTELEDVNNTIKKLWQLEGEDEFDQKGMTSIEDATAMKIVEESMKYSDGMYELKLPWRDNRKLENNYTMALNRLQNTEKKLLKDRELGEKYGTIIDDYLKKGYIEKVENIDINGDECWYLPHFPVIRPDKETTKVRIVFDGAAKFNGQSINDAIYQGPKLQQDLIKVLLRFRKFPVALVCDIAEMYLQIGIHPEDRKYQRILWRNLDQSATPKVYQFKRMVFGINSSPFQAQFVLQEHARRNIESYQIAAEAFLESTYMDDTMDSKETDEEGKELYRQLSTLSNSANMYARKWLSNSTEVLKNIPESDRANKIDLDAGELPSIKTLGIVWNPKEDLFTYHAKEQVQDEQNTKRSLLRSMATLFDPLGFLSPFIIRVKVIMQELWTHGLDWDDPLPEQYNKKVKNWFGELVDLQEIKVQRCLQSNAKVKSRSLHVFTDASSEAYGAVAYQRCIYENGQVSSSFVMSKSRVSPLKAISIPRLELLGAVLGLRLAEKINNSLQMNLKDTTFWSDSMNVLWWIRNQSRKLKPFVANRIGLIQSITSPDQWRYVPTKINPADLPTRGSALKELENNVIWWNGPRFLQGSMDEWPANKFEKTEEAAIEVKQSTTTMLTIVSMPKVRDIDIKRYSSWKRLVSVIGWVKRFAYNCREKVESRSKGGLKADEIEDSQKMLIIGAQLESFPTEYECRKKNRPIAASSRLASLVPLLDEDGILRSSSRLQNADYLPYDVKYPIILPRDHHITKLIVKQYHEDSKHVIGTNHLLSQLSQKYWILRGREVIRQVESECSTCKRMKAKASEQIMAPLPKMRLKMPLVAFSRTGIDYAGPFTTIQGRGRKRTKRYLCLFTCLISRAVHLEIAYSMDTDSFLNAFYRMANRRGLPQEVLTDNGTNFVGGNNELKELVNSLDTEKIQNDTAHKGIRWHFNAPLGPHLGGVFETMIKSAKRAINKILGNADVTDEELHSAFTGAENLLNSRPLTYQSANEKDDIPLTPNHFLFGRAGEQFSPGSDVEPFSPKKRWRRVQELVRHFWKRWMQEWLPTLNRRNKWTREKEDIEAGDIVIVISPDTPKGEWPMGRVIEVYPGKDRHVRVAKVQVGGKQYIRPISRLCRLEVGTFDEPQSIKEGENGRKKMT